MSATATAATLAIEVLRTLAATVPAIAQILERGTRGADQGSIAAQVRAVLPERSRSAAAADVLRAHGTSREKGGP